MPKKGRERGICQKGGRDEEIFAPLSGYDAFDEDETFHCDPYEKHGRQVQGQAKCCCFAVEKLSYRASDHGIPNITSSPLAIQ